MSNASTSSERLPSPDLLLNPSTFWNPAWGLAALGCVFYPWEMLTLYQRVAAVSQREFLDQWNCRFGGGVPLDG